MGRERRQLQDGNQVHRRHGDAGLPAVPPDGVWAQAHSAATQRFYIRYVSSMIQERTESTVATRAQQMRQMKALFVALIYY